MEDFYNAMTTYINSKKPKEICEHERTFCWHGWRTCVKCGLCIHKVFYQDPYSHVSGYNFSVSKEDRFPKIEEIMTDMINSVTKKKVMLSDNRYGWDGPLEDGLPSELSDHLRELCLKCMDLSVKCNTRSLCAVILWEKVKSLYPEVMTLTKFSKKVGVSVPTITKTFKKI